MEDLDTFIDLSLLPECLMRQKIEQNFCPMFLLAGSARRQMLLQPASFWPRMNQLSSLVSTWRSMGVGQCNLKGERFWLRSFLARSFIFLRYIGLKDG